MRAQDYLIKQGLGQTLEGANRTGDDVFHHSMLGATTNASQDYENSRYNSMSKLSTLFAMLMLTESVVE